MFRPYSEPPAMRELRQSFTWWRALSPPVIEQKLQSSRNKADIPVPAICGRRGAYQLWREHLRLGPARSYVCGQAFKRQETRRLARRAADEIRVHHQSESRQANWLNDSA